MKKRMTIWARTAKVLFLAIFSSFGTNAMAQTQTQTRIAVVSDIHVMAPSLLPSGAEETEAWTTYYAGQRKMLEQSAGLFTQFINKMIDEKPDILLITGDLTKDGEQASHNYVKDELLRLKTALSQASEPKSIKIYVIPGNHDFGEEGNHTQFNADGTTGNAPVLSTANFASFYEGYGYGIENDNDNNFVQDPNGSLSYVAEIATDLYLLAIDSHSSNVSEATLTWICDQAQVIRGAGKRVIAMMHHPLFPHITGANMFIDTYTVKFQPTSGDATTYETVRDALIAAGVNVILTGHFHTSDIAYDWNDNQANGIYDINTGSLISYPCDYRMLTLTDNTLSVATASLEETNELKPTESGSKVTWKDWLLGRMTEKAKEKITGYDEPIKSMIADYAAKAYVIHAEGNENSSTDNNRSIILMGASGFPKYAPIFNSMLKDISNYVDGSLNSGHEDRTDDRELTEDKGNCITLTTLEPSGTLNLNLLDNKDNRTAINCYDGKTATVTLTGRTLAKNDKWNTFCVPYGVTAAQIAETDNPLHNAIIRELNATASSLSNTGELTLTFKDAEAIEAGKPYIVKWESGTDITNPVFSDVTINNAEPTAVEFANNAGTEPCKFVGQYNPFAITTDNLNEIIYIGSGNQIGYSKATRTLNCFRAHFWVQPNGTSAGARSINLNLGDGSATFINLVNADDAIYQTGWYSVDGIRLQGEPTKKGVYINNGKKVIIK